jgi:squalene synthase HpnC
MASAQSASLVAATPDALQLRTLAGAENFSVAPAFVGPRLRERLNAIYGFARLVDTLGDELADDRLAALEWLEQDLDRVYSGEPEHPVMRRLVPFVRELSVPREPFVRLIEANRLDQRVHDYSTFDELVAYCDLSANPVGELVLYAFGAVSDENVALSDRVCTALQLVEHWQDVGEDAHRGRIYLPREDRERFGVRDEELVAAHTSDALRALVAFECERASSWMDDGAVLVGRLRGRARAAVAAYVGGGRSALAALRLGGYHVLPAAPKATKPARLRATVTTYGAGR